MRKLKKIKKVQYVVFFCFGILLASTPIFANEVASEGKSYVDGQVIVKFKANAVYTLDDFQAAYNLEVIEEVLNNSSEKIAKLKEKFKKRLKRAPKWANVEKLLGVAYIFRVGENVDIETLCEQIVENEFVEYCHPNYILKTNAIFEPDDPLFHSYGTWGQDDFDQWALRKIKVIDENTGESAWDITQGEGIVVAVIDSGVDYFHTDLYDSLWVNEGEIKLNGIDDDGNGYVDDYSGWVFVPGVQDPYNTMDDVYGHGTWIAGIISAGTDNGEGIAGVAPQSKVMPLKVTYDILNMAPTGEIVEAMEYALYNGADIINLSLSAMSGVASNPLLEETIRFVHSFGMVVVVSAGNMNVDVNNISPANIPETITVAASNENDERATFVGPIMSSSNYGLMIDVTAPGVNVLTTDTMFGGDMLSAIEGANLHVDSNYYRAQGTSMSAALVSGSVALLLANNEYLTNEDVKQILRVTAEDVGAEGFDSDSGYGRINILKALKAYSVPEVKIISPENKTIVDTWDNYVQVSGFASGYNFKDYQLSFRPIDQPEGWIYLEGPIDIPVEGGDLTFMDWNIQGLELGTYVLRLALKTTNGLVFEDVIQVEIADLNSAPVFDSLGTYLVNAGEEVSFYVTAQDSEGDVITYGAIGLPLGATFSEADYNGTMVGQFTWTPTNEQSGIHSVQFTASDGKVQVVSDGVGISVEKTEEGNPPQMWFVYNYRDRYIFWRGYDIEDGIRLKYSYRIDGSDWMKPKTRFYRRVKRLKKDFDLQDGSHVIEVKVIDSDGLESDLMSASFEIKTKKSKSRRGRAGRAGRAGRGGRWRR